MARPTPEERFWAKVNKTDTCWLWTAYVTNKGYGQFGLNNKVLYAHRFAYEWLVGPVPPELPFLDHTCHIKHCVNPEHLRPVTRRQNQENVLGARKGSSSQYLGVHWITKRKKWSATFKHKGERFFLGEFLCEHEAGAATKAKRLEFQTHNDKDRE